MLTGGPGAGKTAVLEVVRQSFCRHVRVLPEAAGILLGGGFPRDDNPASRRAAQRAIYYTQLELESIVDDDGESVTLCDRGTVDGGAYWPGPGDLWSAVGTTRAPQLSRYDAVIRPPTHAVAGARLPLPPTVATSDFERSVNHATYSGVCWVAFGGRLGHNEDR